jgi:hypothetical protein
MGETAGRMARHGKAIIHARRVVAATVTFQEMNYSCGASITDEAQRRK